MIHKTTFGLFLFCIATQCSISSGQQKGSAAAARAIEAYRQRQMMESAIFNKTKKIGVVRLDAKEPLDQSGCLSPSALTSESKGYLEYWHTSVMQVVDKDKMLIRVAKEVLLLDGYDTSDLVDEQEIRLMGPLVASGTYTYKTVVGASKKVRKISFVEKKEAELLIKKLDENPRKIAKKSSPVPMTLRTWNDDSGKHQIEAVFIKLERGKVHLRKKDGETVNLPYGRLSKVDKAWIRKMRQAKK